MVSVVVPVYNTEPYLRHCIDSILAQTYMDLEILLIDDGSTDHSDTIVDSYADPHIRIFHTPNRGLSAARNLGIDNASGDFILFIDSDDWIEPDLIETTITSIDSSDILCFGFNNTSYENHTYNNMEALSTLIRSKLPCTTWSKLYRKECFTNIRFPEGRIYEDIATTYKLFLQANQVKCIEYCGYHYRYREDSLSNTRFLKKYTDHWLAYKEFFTDTKNLLDNSDQSTLLSNCATAIAAAWSWKNSFTSSIPPEFLEMSAFAREHFPLSFHLPLRTRIGITFAKHPNKFSFFLANIALRIYRRFRGKK